MKMISINTEVSAFVYGTNAVIGTIFTNKELK